MFEAYAVGVTLKLNNLVSPQLVLISQGLEKADSLAVALGATIKRLGAESVALKNIAKGADASTIALERASFQAHTLAGRLAAVRVQSAGLGHHLPGMLPLPGGQGGGSGGGGGGAGGGGRGNGFHGGNIHMGPRGIGIGTVGMAAGDAFVPLAITAAALYGGHSLYSSAKDLNTEMQRFKLFGLSDAQNNEAFDFVNGMRVYGTTRAENMRNFREAQGVFRESGESDSKALYGAKLAAPVMAKLHFLESTLGGEEGAKLASANLAMLRYIELSGGVNSAEKFNRLAEFGYKLNMSSGGTIDWNQLLSFKKTAGTAGYNLSEEALARLEPIMAEFSGGRAGTALATGFNRITGITKLPNQVAHMLADYGVWDKSKIEWNANGGVKRTNGNVLTAENAKLYQENPELFYEKVISPIYRKMSLSSDEIAVKNAAIFGRTGGALFNAVERSLPVIHKSMEALEKMKGIEDSILNARQSLTGQEQEFQAAWTDFKTQAGTTMLPFFSGLLRGGSNLLRNLSEKQPESKGLWDSMSNMFTLPFRLGEAIGDGIMGRDPAWGGSGTSTAGGGRGSINPVALPSSGGKSFGNVYLGREKVGKIVAADQAASMGLPLTGGRMFDPSMSPVSVSVGR